MQPLLAACSAKELAAAERAVLETFEANAGGPKLPVRLSASCHFLIAQRR